MMKYGYKWDILVCVSPSWNNKRRLRLKLFYSRPPPKSKQVSKPSPSKIPVPATGKASPRLSSSVAKQGRHQAGVFKAPLPPPAAKAKSVRPSSAAAMRHSSPVKLDRAKSEAAASSSASAAGFQFPITRYLTHAFLTGLSLN